MQETFEASLTVPLQRSVEILGESQAKLYQVSRRPGRESISVPPSYKSRILPRRWIEGRTSYLQRQRWDVRRTSTSTSCRRVVCYESRFVGAYYRRLQGKKLITNWRRRYVFFLTLTNCRKTTRRHVPEVSCLRGLHRANVKSHGTAGVCLVVRVRETICDVIFGTDC